MTIINLNKVQAILNDTNLTADYISKQVSITKPSIWRYRKGEQNIENMSIKIALKLQELYDEEENVMNKKQMWEYNLGMDELKGWTVNNGQLVNDEGEFDSFSACSTLSELDSFLHDDFTDWVTEDSELTESEKEKLLSDIPSAASYF